VTKGKTKFPVSAVDKPEKPIIIIIKEDPLIQVVRTHQHNTDSAVLQAARCLKTEVQKETRKMKDIIAEKTK